MSTRAAARRRTRDHRPGSRSLAALVLFVLAGRPGRPVRHTSWPSATEIGQL